MKRTHASPIIGLVLGGAVFGYILELILQTSGGRLVLPPYTLSVTLFVIAVAVLLLAIPIRRRVTGKRRAALSPFYAVRVAVLAKASTLVGSLLVGFALGILIYVLLRPTTPTWELLGPGIAELISSAVLLAAGLIAEFLCTLPPDDDEKESAGDAATRA
jgi:hypothetical protein